jgi:hypothetical protein
MQVYDFVVSILNGPTEEIISALSKYECIKKWETSADGDILFIVSQSPDGGDEYSQSIRIPPHIKIFQADAVDWFDGKVSRVEIQENKTQAELMEELRKLRILANRAYPRLERSLFCSKSHGDDKFPVECKVCYPDLPALLLEHVRINNNLREENIRLHRLLEELFGPSN